MTTRVHSPRLHQASRPGLVARLNHALAVWRQRQALDRLDARMLRDIGLTEDDVRAEHNRSVWAAPSFWKR
ncbi:MAG: DUF1127 domain-containing protein [Pseudomonadota bacterium]